MPNRQVETPNIQFAACILHQLGRPVIVSRMDALQLRTTLSAGQETKHEFLAGRDRVGNNPRPLVDSHLYGSRNRRPPVFSKRERT
jgi:hypothetical protein